MSNEKIENLKLILKEKGYKLTPQRRSILDEIIKNESSHLTTEEIYDLVKVSCPEIGLATVYRTVQLLEEMGVLYKLDLEELEQGIEKKYNFKIKNHSLKFYGICDNCSLQ